MMVTPKLYKGLEGGDVKVWPSPARYGINQVVSTVVAKLLLPMGDAIALVYGTVMRNLSITPPDRFL